MKKLFFLFFLFFLTACSSANLNNNFNDEVINFDQIKSFDKFKMMLERYNEKSTYPNIDK